MLHLTVQYAFDPNALNSPALGPYNNSPKLPTRAQVRRWVVVALKTQTPTRTAEITVRFTGSEEARQLNHEHRGKNYATNVLTFNLHDETLSDVPLFSDLVICVPVVVREANEQGKTFRAHCAHLVVHGVLHACGLDHQEDAEAEHMEALEAQVLKRFKN